MRVRRRFRSQRLEREKGKETVKGMVRTMMRTGRWRISLEKILLWERERGMKMGTRQWRMSDVEQLYLITELGA